MAPITADSNGVKSNRCSNPSRKVRIIGKIGGLSDKNRSADLNSWISVMKSEEDGSTEKMMVFLQSQSNSRKDGYELDYCYEQEEGIDHIFSREIQPMIVEVFDGRNASVIAVGAKKSGKTYTIQGSQEKPGLAVIAMSEILSKAKELRKSVSISLYELTHEHAKDLLNPNRPVIQVLEDGHGRINLKGLSQVAVKSMSEFHDIYFSQRSVHTQKLPIDQQRNKGLMVHISSDDDKLKAKLSNKINFVDLAGYEDPRKSIRDGITPAESNRNNKTLYALLNVVNAINTNETRVPYRESKLTRILQDSLGGTSHVLLLTCLNPFFCQDSLSFMNLVSRTCRSTKQVLTYSTNISQSSAKVKVLESGKSTSLSVKKQSQLLSAKKASSIVKGRKLFDDVKKVNPKQLRCQSEDTSTQKSKIIPDLALVVTPFSVDEVQAPQDKSNSECSQTREPCEDVNVEKTRAQSMSELQDTLLSSDPNDKLKTDLSPHSVATPVTSTSDAPMPLEAASTCEDNTILHKKDDRSPPLSERIRQISNNLKSLCASSTPLMINMPPNNNQVGYYDIPEPKTPIVEQNIAKYCSPRGTFSNRSAGVKHSFVQEYLNFLNSANKEELKSLKGIGEKRATSILELRENSPEPFKSLDDLQDIGLSAKQIKCMMKGVAGDLFH